MWEAVLARDADEQRKALEDKGCYTWDRHGDGNVHSLLGQSQVHVGDAQFLGAFRLAETWCV